MSVTRRRLLAVPAVFLLSLVLVFTSGNSKPAAAWATPPLPITLGAGTAAAPVMTGVLANPIGLTAATIGFLGIAAYETRDSWLPVVKDWFNATEPTEREPEPAPTGTPTINACQLISAQMVPSGNSAQISVVGSCHRNHYPDYWPDLDYTLSATCKNDQGGISSGVTRQVEFEGTTGEYQYAVSVRNTRNILIPAPTNLCPTGMVPLYIVATPGPNTAWSHPKPPKMKIDGLNGGLPDANYSQTTTVQCRKPDGTLASISDTLTGHPDKIAVPSCAEEFGPGSIPWSVTVAGGPNGTTPQEQISITTEQDVYDEYADCFGPTGLVCEIQVWIDGQPCTFGNSLCAIWPKINRAEPSRMQCRFGQHVVDKSQCSHLAHAYADVVEVTQVTTDGSPQFNPNPNPNPTPAPQPSPFPTTGTNPGAPSTTPGTGTNPDSRSCFGDAWSLNPVDWVYVPVKCVFLWAFVPSTSLDARLANVRGAVETKMPFSIFGGFAAIPAAVPGGSCPDWRIQVLDLDRNVVCGSSFTDAIRASRPVFVVFMGALALWPLIRSVAYSAVPIFKPVPGGGR